MIGFVLMTVHLSGWATAQPPPGATRAHAVRTTARRLRRPPRASGRLRGAELRWDKTAHHFPTFAGEAAA